jgi:hemophore-related protein
MTGVMAATTTYLYTHPPVNDFFTTLKGKSPDDRRAALEEYMTANPQVGAELQGIRQPMKDFRNRCG